MNIYSFCFLLTPILQQKYSLRHIFANNYTIQLTYKLYRCFYDIIFAISMPNLYAINEGIRCIVRIGLLILFHQKRKPIEYCLYS